MQNSIKENSFAVPNSAKANTSSAWLDYSAWEGLSLSNNMRKLGLSWSKLGKAAVILVWQQGWMIERGVETCLSHFNDIFHPWVSSIEVHHMANTHQDGTSIRNMQVHTSHMLSSIKSQFPLQIVLNWGSSSVKGQGRVKKKIISVA